MGHAVLLGHDAGPDQLLDLTIKGLHAFRSALFHCIDQRFSFRLSAFNVLPGARRGLQNLESGDAPGAIGTRQKAL